MTKTLPRMAASLMMLTLALGLVGCAGPTSDQPSATPSATTQPGTADNSQQNAALDSYIAAGQASLPSLKATYATTYSDIQIVGVRPGTVEYDYVYLDQVDTNAAATYLDNYVPTFQTLCDTQLFPGMISAGITVAPKVTYVYYNADGSEIWSHTFSPS